MRRLLIFTGCVSALWFALLWSSPSLADGEQAGIRSAARALSIAALKQYRAEQYAPALEGFQRAHALVKLPTTGIWVARCLHRLGRWVEASEQYVRVAHMTAAEGPHRDKHLAAIDEAAKEHLALDPQIPKLTISVVGPAGETVAVQLGSGLVPSALWGVAQPVDPGERTVVLRARGKESRQTVMMRAGERQVVNLSIGELGASPSSATVRGGAPDAGPAAATSSNALVKTGWVVMGVGVASLVIGAVTLGVGLSEGEELRVNCPNQQCETPYHDDVDSYETLQVVSTATLIGGTVLALGGTGLLLSGPRSPNGVQTASWQWGVAWGPSRVSLQGKF